MVKHAYCVAGTVSLRSLFLLFISLSPTLHRAFDRGLISITADYIVKVSGLVNDKDSKFTLSQFENKSILLPKKEAWFPSFESITWHQKKIFLE